MKTKKITILAMVLFYGLLQLNAQKVCEDWNGYVDSKNANSTGYFNLTVGYEERASQSYHYSGPGKIGSVRVYGAYTGIVIPLRVSIYNVDSKGRPTNEIKGEDFSWWFYNSNYREIAFSGGGVTVNGNFAVVVSIRSGPINGTVFQVKYTGNGEGKGQDLASLAGTATGGNWTSAMTSYNKDGDFYLVPKMSHDLISGFTVPSKCFSANSSVQFSNTSKLTKDSMFNTIAWSGYKGGAHLYSWNFGDGGTSFAENPSHTYVNAGAYTARLIVTVAGWNNTKSDTISIRLSVGLSVSTSGISNANCNGSSNGSVTALGSGGVAPYKYSLNGVTYQTSATFNGLSAGAYTLYVQDALLCVASSNFSITQPTAITFSTVGTTDATCNASNGAILAVGSGGSGALQYKLNAGSFQGNGNFQNLAAGSYLITMMDGNSCSASKNTIVNNTSSPVLGISGITYVSCFGGNDGSIVLTSTGGTGSVQYSVNGGTNFQSGGTFNSLGAGTYSVLVKDAAGCTNGQVVVITQPNRIDFNVSSVPSSCFGQASGEIHVSSTIGGVGKFSYSINGTNYQSSPDFYGLKAGAYTVYAKDFASCIVSKAANISEPSKIVSTKTVTDAICNGSNTGTILVSSNGGTPYYSFSLDGNDYQATGLFNNIGAGNHIVNVRDVNLCKDTVIVSVGQPTPLAASVNTSNSTCGNSNGGMLVVASGGTGSSYTYSLDGSTWVNSGQFTGKSAGTYYIAVKDAAGCITVVTATIMDSNGPTFGAISNTSVTCNGGSDGSITVNSVTGGTGAIEYSLDGILFQSSSQFKNLKAGNYIVVVKDANGCRSNSAQILLTQPNPILISKSISNVTCFGENNGEVTITAIGGAGALAYSIDGGTTFQSDKTFRGLYAGDYVITVRDAGKCTNSVFFTLTQSSKIDINTGILNVTCHGAANGELTVYASGGKPPYLYSLGASYQSSNTFTGLFGASYTCYVKDANNCIVTKEVDVTEPAELLIFQTVSDVSCAGGNNGVIDLTITGGVMPYTFRWSNRSTSEDIFNLKAGNYSVVVKDGNGCEKTASFILTEPTNPIVINGVVVNTIGNTGSIDITVTGGVQPYRFLWSNGQSSEDISGLTPGNYTVTVIDANNCAANSQFKVQNSTGVTIQELGGQLKMYPNPAGESVSIELAGYNVQRVNIVNSIGQVVYSSESFNGTKNINVIDFTPGIYYVEIIAEGYKVMRKLTIAR
jgi:hypothetical protein